MAIFFYNSLTRKKEEFKPIKDGEVRMYTCGPTVYNYPHIGNLRTFIFEDLLHRWLEYRGFKVIQVMNLTDVDDKTIKNSIAKKMTLKEYTDIYKKAFFEDIEALNIKKATYYPAATEYINEMIDMIKVLMEKGYAYETNDGIYFKISEFKEYGKLAHLEKDELKAGASGRVSLDEYEKENISDFALWKKWTPEDGNVKWNSPFGEGRPGWHIECSVMSMKLLGETFDIHCGGIDNLFPHHENEIAQSEAYSGKKFVNYWLHSVHLIVNGEKMSKSKGNFFTLRDLLAKGYSPRAIRYALITTHYRKPLNFTFDLLTQANSSLKRIDDFIFSLKNVSSTGKIDDFLDKVLINQIKKFEDAMDDDLNISEAMAAIFELINSYYENFEKITRELANKVIDTFIKFDTVLGFIFFDKKQDELSEEEKELIEERIKAKKEKNYARADEIRNILLSKGIELRDTKDGVVWKRIK
ncbi:MAG: cysteine--tRNA ligase [Brevinematales bacterium]